MTSQIRTHGRNGFASTRTKWSALFILALIAGVGGAVHALNNKSKDGVLTVEEAEYDRYVIGRSDLLLTVSSSGLVKPENKLDIKPPIAGRLEEVLVVAGQKVKKGETLAWMSSSERAALLDGVRLQSAKALKKWESYYKPTPIFAPIDGTIILATVKPGQTFTPSDSVFTMSDRLTIKAQVDETDIGKVAVGQKAEFVLDAFPNDVIPSRVDQIAFDSTVVNSVTTYVVDVLPDKTPDTMRSGMTATIKFLIAQKKASLFVPVQSIRTRAGKFYVLVPEQKSTSGNAEASRAVEVHVQLGGRDEDKVELLSGLKEGDVILVRDTNDQN